MSRGIRDKEKLVVVEYRIACIIVVPDSSGDFGAFVPRGEGA